MLSCKLSFQTPDERPVPAQWAYQCYSALLASLSAKTAEFLHEAEFTPLNQHLLMSEARKCVWTVNITDEALCDEVASALESIQSIDILPQGVSLSRLHYEQSEFNARDFLLAEPICTLNRFSFQTPSTFKTDGKYALFPSEKLIAQSLMNRWNACFPEFSMSDEDAFQMLIKGLNIQNYRLSSRRFPLKAAVVTGFVGYVDIRSHLAAPLEQLWSALVSAAPYLGVGIKTTLGMGAVSTSALVMGESANAPAQRSL